jgi:tRNA threonylcarbamoyladenosine biosynthesis protein TsaB
VLGIDTSTADSVVAVSVEGELASERATGPATGDGRPRHADTLLAEVDAAVSAAGGWERIGTIAIGVGPGTFTGLRIGVATARALAQARELPVAAVSSLAALARGIDPARAPERPRLALIDARRGEVFAALHAVAGAMLWEPLVATPDSIAERVADLGAAPLAAGDGSLRFRAQLEAAGVDVLPDADPAHRMAARHVCALAAGVEPGRPEHVRPIYLRRPDAEVWRERGNRDSDHRRP